MPAPIVQFRPSRRHLIFVAVFALGLYILVPQFGDFKSSWHALQHPIPSWTALAIIFTFATYLFGALTYVLLAFKPLRYTQTVLVQMAAMFINRLVPAGVGSLGVNFLYLKKTKHSDAQAASVVAVNNILGFMGHGLLLLVALATARQTTTSLQLHKPSALLLYVVIAVAIVVLLAVVFRKRFLKLLKEFYLNILSYRKRPARLLLALLSSMILTACNVLALYFCMQALGVQLGLLPVLLILSFGVGAGVATPTPGGLGGFEAGLVAGFVAYGIDAPIGLAIALLYRFISYWLMLVVGIICFGICRRKQIF